MVKKTTTMPNVEERIHAHKRQRAIIEENQRNFERIAHSRSRAAKITSGLFCPCTCTAYCVHFVVCIPTLIYYENCFDASRERMGCGLERPPQNRRELCCRYCTPICDTFPDINLTNGRDNFTHLEERDGEKQRIESLNLLNTEINKWQELIAQSKNPGGSLLASRSIEILPSLTSSPSQEKMMDGT
jgi:hypothetical protein